VVEFVFFLIRREVVELNLKGNFIFMLDTLLWYIWLSINN
jgi:hypothetical protein